MIKVMVYRFALTLIFQLSLAQVLGAATPTEALLKTLDQVRASNRPSPNLTGLIITDQIGPSRKAILAREWDNLREWLDAENVILTGEKEKVSGNLAAVLVGGESELGPESGRVLVFGLRKIAGQWQVAPSEGSFSNAGVAFDPESRKRMKELERWMMDQRAIGGSQLIARQKSRFFDRLKKAVSSDDLRSLEPEKVMARFLKAAREKNADELLLWLGALEPGDRPQIRWSSFTKLVRRGLLDRDKRKVWRLLTDPSVIVLTGAKDVDGDSGYISQIFLTPYETGQTRNRSRLHAIKFEMEDAGAGWRITLPGFFEGADLSLREHANKHRESQNYQADQVKEQFGELFEAAHQARHFETPAELMEDLIKSVEDRNFTQYLQTVYRLNFRGVKKGPPAQKDERAELRAALERIPKEARIDLEGVLDQFDEGFEVPEDKIGDKEVDLETLQSYRQDLYLKAALSFSNFAPLGSNLELKFHEILTKNDLGLVVMQVTPPAGAPQYIPLWVARAEGKWAYLSTGLRSVGSILPEELRPEADDLHKQYLQIAKERKNNFEKDVVSLAKLFDAQGKGASSEEAAKIVATWRESLKSQPLKEILTGAGLIKRPGNARFFIKDMRFRLKAAKAGKNPDKVLGVETKGRFSGVSLLVDAVKGRVIDCPLLIVAPTPDGPRVMADVDLTLSSNGGRKLRNADTLASLLQSLKKEDFQSVRELLEWHEKLAQPAWDAWHEAMEEEKK